jgi:hypothetical protein
MMDIRIPATTQMRRKISQKKISKILVGLLELLELLSI